MDIEAFKERLQRMTPMDDLFFGKLIEDKEAAEEILKTLLHTNALEVKSIFPQKTLLNLMGRSVRLDSLLEVILNGKTVYVNIESQKYKDNDPYRRLRFHHSHITASFSQKNTPFENLPDVICIYMTVSDRFHRNRSISNARFQFTDGDPEYPDGLMTSLVNAKIDDGTPVSRLMKVMSTADHYSDEFPAVSARKKLLKDTQKGVHGMRPWYQDFFDEEYQKGLEKGIQEGREKEQALSAEKIKLMDEELKKMKEENQKLNKALEENQKLNKALADLILSNQAQQA
jgi:hypothetical protein